MGKILGKSKTFQYWTFQSKTFKSWIFQSQTSQSSGKMNFLVPDFSVLNFTVPDFTVQLKNELFSPRLYSPIGKWTFQSQTLQSNWKTNFSVPDFWVQHQNDKKNWVPHIFDRIQLYDFHTGTSLGKVFLAEVLWFMQNCTHAEIAFSNSTCNHNVIIQYSQQKKKNPQIACLLWWNIMECNLTFFIIRRAHSIYLELKRPIKFGV